MARPATREDAVSTRTRLLDAAESAFAAAGYEGARLADIAAEAGIRRPSLLYHFGSKLQLYTAVVERTFADLGTALTGALTARSTFEDLLIAPIEQFHLFLDARPTAARILLRDLLDDDGPGRAIMVQHAVPILALVERFLLHEGRDHIPAGFPLRAAMMQAVSNLLLWSAAGPLRQPLWGGDHKSPELARMLWTFDPVS